MQLLNCLYIYYFKNNISFDIFTICPTTKCILSVYLSVCWLMYDHPVHAKLIFKYILIYNKCSPLSRSVFTMIILTLCVTGLGLLSSSSSRTRAKWLSCQIGCPSLLSLDNCVRYILENADSRPLAHKNKQHALNMFSFEAEFHLPQALTRHRLGRKS